MTQRSIWIPMGLVLVGGGLGCQVPSYQLPAGYSSTYARSLNAERPFAPLPGELGPGEGTPGESCQGVFYPQTFRYDPPTQSEFQQAVRVPETGPPIRRRY